MCLDTLANRRHECCMKFISEVRECKCDNNPLVPPMILLIFMNIIFGITILLNFLIRGQNDSRELLRLNIINN